ncbi:MAG TPA: hypothetical protein VED87_07085, partial [Methylocystis sp.]|nr:hypothetical protein [Methylocystis sp.]
GRRALVDLSALPGTIKVAALRLRLRCTACGDRPYDVRPNWSERMKPVGVLGAERRRAALSRASCEFPISAYRDGPFTGAASEISA